MERGSGRQVVVRRGECVIYRTAESSGGENWLGTQNLGILSMLLSWETIYLVYLKLSQL